MQINGYPSWLKLVGRPLRRSAWLVASKLIDVRSFNGERIRLPSAIKGKFAPLNDTKYEMEEYEALSKFGKSGQAFLDIGANVGIMTVIMSKIAGLTGSVVACEPNPKTYCMLADVLEVNECTNVLSIQAVILDKCGTQRFFLSEVGGLGVRSSIATKDPGSQEVILPAISVDALYHEHGVQLDYIKVDAEGADYKILLGAKQTLSHYRPLVQVEIHGQYMRTLGDSVESLFEFMITNSYLCINIPTWSVVDVSEFMQCTHCHAFDTFTGEDMAYQGYGQVIFIPVERRNLLQGLTARKCKVCN